MSIHNISTQSTPVLLFTYQSQHINFVDWVSLLTLCLAPLIAHIIAGTPEPVYLDSTRPRWHDRLVQYNPTSILWRYFAITDRRVRSKPHTWTALDMAATNALFWTSQGWDGSESLMSSSRTFLFDAPSRTMTSLVSSDTLKTLIVTLQGVQAIYTWTGAILTPDGFFFTIALDTIFAPFAIFGLLRLPAALWLTEQRCYLDSKEDGSIDRIPQLSNAIVADSISQTSGLVVGSEDIVRTNTHREETVELLALSKTQPQVEVRMDSVSDRSEQFHLPMSKRGISVRMLFLLPILSLLALDLYFSLPQTSPPGPEMFYSVTTTLQGIYYAFFLIFSLCIYISYFFLGRHASSPISNTTVLPCISTKWYKYYTGLLIAFTFVLFVSAALETRKTPCGSYTAYPYLFDNITCSNGLYINGSSPTGPFAIASKLPADLKPNGTINSTQPVLEGGMVLFRATGWYQGSIDRHPVVIASVNETLT